MKDDSQNTVNDKNNQASSQKLRQRTIKWLAFLFLSFFFFFFLPFLIGHRKNPKLRTPREPNINGQSWSKVHVLASHQ